MAAKPTPKGPGTSIPSYTDFLGQEIVPGDHVIVLGLFGKSASGYTAQVLDIHEVAPKYRGDAEIKLCCEPTGAYSGSCHHDWPYEEDPFESAVKGHTVRVPTGERPRANWIMSRNVLRSPVQDVPDNIRTRYRR